MHIFEEGKNFKRYTIQKRLGSSGSGASYAAEDTLLQRKVTLKQINPWGPPLPDAARRQFFREMQDISAFIHPCLAAVLDYGEIDGQLYIARRYVTPGSLLGSEGRYWFNPPLDVAAAISYTGHLAAALQTIHNYGYVHGALTFTNILVLRGPDTYKDLTSAPFLLSDVGNAHFVRRFGQPPTSLLPITAAPEQFGKRVIAASDQYALATILYFWLTGRPPFIGTPTEIEQLKLTETITTLTALNLKVPLELEGVIRRALSVYPEDRYPSIQAFADALRASIKHMSQTSLPPLEQVVVDIPQPVPEPKPIPPLEIMQDPLPVLHLKDGSKPEEIVLQASILINSPYTENAQEFLLEQEETTLGRAGSSHILLDQDTLTSRHHALLKHNGDHYEIYDLRSANGILVNGQKILDETAHTLNDGDQITIGDYELTFCLKQANLVLEQVLREA